ncbi:gpW family head-tail joining protein [Marivivens aquimaris]|uniref:gpW family head-tail joining protein n=1 Tax=Marivivens aquimaris TaxID=2774876 RepID=UPI0018802605|nr:gpW family head-tail joining protein [Marivivens aquimaris]
MTEMPEDPCAVLAELRAAHRAIITGQQVREVRHNSGASGTDQQVTYGPADVAALNREIARYETLCTASCGKKSRFAISTGGRR